MFRTPDAKRPPGLRRIGLEPAIAPSRRAGGVHGNSYCKFAQANTKGHALALADYLEKKVTLDQPINIHLTGCPHSCAQHYMGDIGLLATKGARRGSLSRLCRRRVWLRNRQWVAGVQRPEVEELKPTLEKMLKGYCAAGNRTKHSKGSRAVGTSTASKPYSQTTNDRELEPTKLPHSSTNCWRAAAADGGRSASSAP